MALAAVADTRRNSEIHLCSPTFQRCLTDLRSTFRFSEKCERMFSSRFLIRKLASLLSGRRRSTPFGSPYAGFRTPEGSFMQRSRSLFTSEQLNSFIRRNTKALQLINGSFFSINSCSFCKNDTLPWEVLWRKPAEPGQQWNSGKSGIIGGFFFPLVRQRTEIYQHNSSA